MSLSIYIYFIEHYEKIKVMSFHNISNTGEYPIQMNSSWFDPSLKLQNSPNHDARFYLISTDVNPVTEMSNLNSAWPPPVPFSALGKLTSKHSYDVYQPIFLQNHHHQHRIIKGQIHHQTRVLLVYPSQHQRVHLHGSPLSLLLVAFCF